MTLDIGTAFTAIDGAIGNRECRQCGRPANGSPSLDFCSEDCQQSWHEQQTGVPAPGNRTTPDGSVSQTAPARPLGWLRPPQPGPTVRAGQEVLDDIAAFVARFSVFPSEHCAATLALWYAHTHAIEQFYVTPGWSWTPPSPALEKRGCWKSRNTSCGHRR